MAFAAPIAAFSATQRTPEKFNAVFRFGITPLFLFSGTFFPLSNLPEAIRPIAWLSPLWHGVELSRGLALGTIGQEPALALAHVAILVAIVVVGHALGLPDRRGPAGRADDGLVPAALLAVHARQPPGALPRRAQHLRLPPRLDRHPLGLLRAALLPRLDRVRAGRARRRRSTGRAASRSPYQLFVAPALLASAAMNGAIAEGTFNFFFKLRYNKTFDAILATPLSAGDIAVGELVWALIRGGIYAIAFLLVMAVLGLVASPWVILDVPGRAADRVRVRRRRRWPRPRSCGRGRTST